MNLQIKIVYNYYRNLNIFFRGIRMDINCETCYLYQIADINLSSRTLKETTEINNSYKLIDESCIDIFKQKIINTKPVGNSNMLYENVNIARKGDIIFSLKQNFIKGELCAALIEEDNILVPNNSFALIIPKDKSKSDDLMFLLKDDYVISQIKPLDTGSNYFNITVKELNNILIPTQT